MTGKNWYLLIENEHNYCLYVEGYETMEEAIDQLEYVMRHSRYPKGTKFIIRQDIDN